MCDHELIGQNLSGLDLITQLKIAPASFLVTNCYEDHSVRELCAKINLKMIPKDFSAFIPIEVKNLNPDLILIDNDPLLAAAWQIKAKSVNKNIAIFNDAESALNAIVSFAKDTAIYIDSDLGNKIKGEEIAKTLYLKGFNTIYLTTGFDVNQFPPMFWIKEIVGKLPPF